MIHRIEADRNNDSFIRSTFSSLMQANGSFLRVYSPIWKLSTVRYGHIQPWAVLALSLLGQTYLSFKLFKRVIFNDYFLFWIYILAFPEREQFFNCNKFTGITDTLLILFIFHGVVKHVLFYWLQIGKILFDKRTPLLYTICAPHRIHITIKHIVY